MAKTPPTVRMRRLGAQLRKLREQRGLNLDEAAAMLNMSKSALNRMENAQVTVRPYEVTYLLMMYEVTDQDLHDSLLGLAAAGRSKDWIKRHGALSPGPIVGDFIRLEQDSSVIRIFQPQSVPGQLQTPEYARAIMMSVPHDPSGNVEQAVAFRMARQEALSRPSPVQVHAVIGEAAVRQRLGGTEVLCEQLRHVLNLSLRENVKVQVLPFDTIRHPGVDGPFTMLNVETGGFTIVVIDSLARSVYLEDDAEIARYSVVFDELCTEALSEQESRMLIERALGELGNSSAEGAL